MMPGTERASNRSSRLAVSGLSSPREELFKFNMQIETTLRVIR
jgi:hypothetical protein